MTAPSSPVGKPFALSAEAVRPERSGVGMDYCPEAAKLVGDPVPAPMIP